MTQNCCYLEKKGSFVVRAYGLGEGYSVTLPEFSCGLGNSSCLSMVHSFIYKQAERVSFLKYCLLRPFIFWDRGTSLYFSPRLNKWRPCSW